jgi:hypothetical protein
MFYKITASTANLADISSTNSATFNVLASSSATIGRLGSTGSITANTLTASSASIGQISSTGSATFNTIASSSANIKELYASSAVFGNSTSYATFEEDGTLIFEGDAKTYRDELGDVTKLKIVGIAIAEDTTDGVVNISTQADLSSFLYCNVQLNHDRDVTAPVYPHIHWFQSSGNAPNLLFQYRWQSNGAEKTTTWTDLKSNALAHPYSSGIIHQISYSTVGILATTGVNVSDIVQFRIIRDTQNASTQFSSTDNYSLPVSLLSFDVHVLQDSIGSRTEYLK